MVSSTVSHARLRRAFERAKSNLLATRTPDGHWVGKLASSALSTATAVSALAIYEQRSLLDHDDSNSSGKEVKPSLHNCQLIQRGLRWLQQQQNEDGGWGDTDVSYSNIATTMLVVAAFRLTGVPANTLELLRRAEDYIKSQGGENALYQRYGRDKTFAVPILANCALAGMVDWSVVSPLPFELACIPQRWYRWARLPVVSYAIPALVAVGQAVYWHDKPWNPFVRIIREKSIEPSLRVLDRIQPQSGGYLEAIPLTSFVIMCLASTRRSKQSVVQRGIEFLRSTARDDGGWPIDTDLATWNTSLSMCALAVSGEKSIRDLDCLPWLLSCQQTEQHPYTGAAPGGWGWSDKSGAVPDADDTAGALVALVHCYRVTDSRSQKDRILQAAQMGIDWLLNIQNSDGGWPTFCRGWGKLPFDRSGSDLTAHALKALQLWKCEFDSKRLRVALAAGAKFLRKRQCADGSWIPLWFGNQDHPEELNPVYGTSRVLEALRVLGWSETEMAIRARQWLVSQQNMDGSWGVQSVEESALALSALLSTGLNESLQTVLNQGLEWLVSAVETGQHTSVSPIGFYFAKLWYHEQLYPLVFTVSALGRALKETKLVPQTSSAVTS